jgi:hypothetical protein
MKKAKQVLLGGILAMGMSMGLASCLEETGSSGAGVVLGVIYQDATEMVADTKHGILRSSDFERFCQPGDCILFRYAYDSNVSENADYTKTNRLFVSLLEKPEFIPFGEGCNEAADTSSLLEGEIPLVSGLAQTELSTAWALLRYHFFITSTVADTSLTIVPDSLRWFFYCDPEQETEKDQNDYTVYTAYLRAVAPADAPARTDRPDPMALVARINVYPLEEVFNRIVEREKDKDKQYFTLRLGYLTGISPAADPAGTPALTWTYVTAAVFKMIN